MPTIKLSYLRAYPGQVIYKEEEKRIDCPFCYDTGGHCYCNMLKLVFHCHKCGTSGKVVDDTQNYSYHPTTFEQVLRAIRETDKKENKKHDVRNLPRMIPIGKYYQWNKSLGIPDSSPAIYDYNKACDYLWSRGLTQEEVDNNKIAWCPDKEGPYANSIVFPCGTDAEPYFVCRKLAGNPKYINAPWPKGNNLYFPVYNRTYDFMIIVEGPFDAIKGARIDPTVGLLGKTANKEQLHSLCNIDKKFIILLDPDAWEHSVRLKLGLMAMADQLGRKIQVVNHFLPKWDPGDMATEELRKELDQAMRRFK